jgi:EEF1A lysine methyltransferase 2
VRRKDGNESQAHGQSSWDSCYERELKNYSEHPDDEGTVWFSDSGAEEKVIDYICNLAEEGKLVQGSNAAEANTERISFLDLGTGNGHLLFTLREYGFSGYMLGVDYSPLSVQLARNIEKHRQEQILDRDVDETWSSEPVYFQELDILSPQLKLSKQFDVLLDKGTFDAISLSSETDSHGRRTSEQYRSRIKPFLKGGGLLIITSCNWTEEELRNWFEVEEPDLGQFIYEDRIKYPTFRFQGQEGQSVVTLCFKKI